MPGRKSSGRLRRDYVTIHFLQGESKHQPLVVDRTWLVLGIILLVFFALSVRVWQQMQVVKLGYQITQYRQQQQALLDEQHTLLSRRNALASLERIETIARSEMGLETPRSEQLVFLADPAAGLENSKSWFPGAGIVRQWLQKWRGKG